MELSVEILQFFFGGFFIYSASKKMGKPSKLWKQITEYKILNNTSNKLLASSLPATEFFLGLFISSNTYPRQSLIFTLILLLSFTFAMLVTLKRGMEIECGCMGGSTKVSIHTIVRNLTLIALTIFLIFETTPETHNNYIVLTLSVIAVFVITTFRYRQLSH